jgi:hypothetical protein
MALRALFLVGAQCRRSRSAHAVSDPKKTNKIRLFRIYALISTSNNDETEVPKFVWQVPVVRLDA